MTNLLDKIFIVEDDETIRLVLEMLLKGAGYDAVRSFAAGDAAMEAIRRERPDLVLLDLMLPGLDGLSICRLIREDSSLQATRILMLTARTQPEDIVKGLTAGADDYVTKPFDRQILLARIGAVLRRGLPVMEGRDFAGLRIDPASRVVTLDGRTIELTTGEFNLLARLVAHRGRIFVRPPDERTVDVQVASLRRKLGAWAQRIETIRGIGYRVKV